MLNWPPMRSAASNSVTSWPRSAAVVAHAMPAGPAPITATFFAVAARPITSSVSWQARGLTRQDVSLPLKMWSRQAWLQAMQVLISSALFAAALTTKSASARKGRAIDTMSAQPEARTSSATSGVLIRLVVTSGILTAPLSRLVTQAKAARGTIVAMVGMRASCQPMPVLMMVAPAVSIACARATTSSQVLPPWTRSSIDRRKMMMKSGPTFSRVARTISTGKRMRFAKLPPHSSSRRLVCGATNWLIR